MRHLRFTLVTLALAVGAALYGSATVPSPPGYLPGDCLFYALTAESLLLDGDLDLTNQLVGDRTGEAAREELRKQEGYFAVSPAGRIVPKHSTLMPILSIPFIAFFGTVGFLIFNVLQVVVLVRGVAALAGDTVAARVLAVLLFVTSSWLTYAFNYSPDLFGALLVVWAYAFARRGCWFWCGMIAGLAVWAKVYLGLVVLPLAIVVLPAGRRAVVLAGVAALLALLPMFALNSHLYGGPLTTGYDRDARVSADGYELTEHYSRFNQPFLSGLRNVLFDPDLGMARTCPLWFIWPLAWVLILKPGATFPRRIAAAACLGAVANVCLFAPYDEWNATLAGNRFLFPAVALGGAVLEPFAAAGLAWLRAWWNERRR